MTNKSKWELVEMNGQAGEEMTLTERMKVPEGWIVKHQSYEETPDETPMKCESICFIPDKNHVWEN